MASSMTSSRQIYEKSQKIILLRKKHIVVFLGQNDFLCYKFSHMGTVMTAHFYRCTIYSIYMCLCVRNVCRSRFCALCVRVQCMFGMKFVYMSNVGLYVSQVKTTLV